MWRAAASLERVPAVSKEGLGDVALRNAVAGRGDYTFWALGRFGSRVPLYASPEEVVSLDKVEHWLERLLAQDWSKARGVALCVAQLARLCGDPERDINEALRRQIISRLQELQCPDSLISLVSEVKVLHETERGQMFGDALPAGLRIAE